MVLDQFEPMGCPRCSRIFKRVMRKMKHPSGAILDVCDKCGGMWVDKNEVRRLYHYSIKTEATVQKPVRSKKKKGKK